MKKVLQSFLSRVTSLISFVMLTSLPATGGTLRKSRILERWSADIGVNNMNETSISHRLQLRYKAYLASFSHDALSSDSNQQPTAALSVSCSGLHRQYFHEFLDMSWYFSFWYRDTFAISDPNCHRTSNEFEWYNFYHIWCFNNSITSQCFLWVAYTLLTFLTSANQG